MSPISKSIYHQHFIQKGIFLVGYIWILFIILWGCKPKETLTIGGSETLHGTLDYLASAYEKENPNIRVEVIGGGSQVGINLLKEGKIDMAISSRDLTEEELVELNQEENLEKLIIAYDGIAIVVHPDNPLQKITAKETSDIFSGQIQDWSKLGGKPGSIQPIVRNDNSGTLRFFTNYVLKGKLLASLPEYSKKAKEFESREFASNALAVKDNQDMANAIAQNPNSIGFMGMGSALVENKGKVKVLDFARHEKEPYVTPSPKNVLERKYKLSRGLYAIYKSENKEKVEAFTTFLTSNKGQELILKRGYLRASLPEVEVKASE